MSKYVGTSKMREIWRSGPGPFPHEISFRLLKNHQGYYFEISRRGKTQAPLLLPKMNKFDLPLHMTSLLARKCPEITRSDLALQERDSRHLLRRFGAPKVTVCFGPRLQADRSQLLHFGERDFSAHRHESCLLIRGRSRGENSHLPYQKNWVCWINTPSVADADFLLTYISQSVAPVIAYDQKTLGIRAANVDTWISVGFTIEMMLKYAEAEAVSLQRKSKTKDNSQMFGATKKPTANV